jgi:WD40 repeat protein
VFPTTDIPKNGSAGVTACEFAPKGNTIVSGSRDKTLKIWDVASGTCQATLEGHSSCVNCVQFNPADAGQLVTGSWDKTLKVWSVADGQLQQTFTGHG